MSYSFSMKEIHNNRAFFKRVVIGRKNWIFSNRPQVTWASAIIYIVETALGMD